MLLVPFITYTMIIGTSSLSSGQGLPSKHTLCFEIVNDLKSLNKCVGDKYEHFRKFYIKAIPRIHFFLVVQIFT